MPIYASVARTEKCIMSEVMRAMQRLTYLKTADSVRHLLFSGTRLGYK